MSTSWLPFRIYHTWKAKGYIAQTFCRQVSTCDINLANRQLSPKTVGCTSPCKARAFAWAKPPLAWESVPAGALRAHRSSRVLGCPLPPPISPEQMRSTCHLSASRLRSFRAVYLSLSSSGRCRLTTLSNEVTGVASDTNTGF